MRPLVTVALAVALVCSFVAPPVAAADTGCQFVLGFKTLHNLIGTTVGNCLVNEHYNPQNGDALQETTHGLLVWRKVDNWTAFTDGYRSWINGPLGLQQRLNTAHFPWEHAAPAPASTACLASQIAVQVDRLAIAADGSAPAQATVNNQCDRPVDVAVDVLGLSGPGGTPLLDVPTIYLQNVPARASRTLAGQIPQANTAPATSWSWTWVMAGQDACIDVGVAKCLNVDPPLADAAVALKGVPDALVLLRTAATAGVQIRSGLSGTGTFGRYTPATKTITIDSSLDGRSAWVRATILAHELQHASDDATGQLGKTSLGCYLDEARAFGREAEIWAALWQDKLPPNLDSVHTELNDITITVARDPVDFALALVSQYQGECGG